MEPEQLPATNKQQNASPPASPPVEKSLKKDPEQGPDKDVSVATSSTATLEHSAKQLTEELKGLLNGKAAIDEKQAKKLRKSWDALRQNKESHSLDLKALEDGFEALRARVHHQVESRNLDYSRIEEEVERLGKAVQSGDLKLSQQLEQKVIASLNRIKGLSSQRRQKIITTLESLQPKIKKLSSWRKWGTVQARQKIIDEIKHIHNTEKSLEKVAKRIQQVREQWKAWDHSGEGGDHKLYQAFDTACSEAYKPCKAFFDNQRKQRQASSKHRTAVCELLEKEYASMDWREPDWKHVQKSVREQQARWRKLGPPEFKDKKPLQTRFDAVIAKFDGPLDRERKRNLKAREALIEEATKLAALEDARLAISKLQQLKKDWQVSVSGGRRQEQAIWRSFTEACDKVYQHGREEKKEFDQQLQENLQKKQELCEQIESAFEPPTDEAPITPSALSAQVRKWKGVWVESGKAPKNQVKKIEQRYRDAIKKIEKRLAELTSKNQVEIDQRLFSYAEICCEVESHIQAKSNTDMDIDKIQQRWQAGGDIAESLQKAIQDRFDLALAAIDNADQHSSLLKRLESNFEQINQYLLQLEIEYEVESPTEYAKQRMAMQIARLSAAMGKSQGQEILPTEQLIARIHTTGAIEQSLQKAVNQRFNTCYKKIHHDNH